MAQRRTWISCLICPDYQIISLEVSGLRKITSVEYRTKPELNALRLDLGAEEELSRGALGRPGCLEEAACRAFPGVG